MPNNAPTVQKYDAAAADQAKVGKQARMLTQMAEKQKKAHRSKLGQRGMLGSGAEVGKNRALDAEVLRGTSQTAQEVALNRQAIEEKTAEQLRGFAHQAAMQESQQEHEQVMQGSQIGFAGEQLEWEKSKYGTGLEWEKSRYGQELQQRQAEFASKFGLEEGRLTLDQDKLQFQYDSLDEQIAEAQRTRQWDTAERLGKERQELEVQARMYEETGRARAWESSENITKYTHELTMQRENLNVQLQELGAQMQNAQADRDFNAIQNLQRLQGELTMQANQLSADEYEAGQQRQFLGELEQLQYQHQMGMLDAQGQQRLGQMEFQHSSSMANLRETAMFQLQNQNIQQQWGGAMRLLDQDHQRQMAEFQALIMSTGRKEEYDYTKGLAWYSQQLGGNQSGGTDWGWLKPVAGFVGTGLSWLSGGGGGAGGGPGGYSPDYTEGDNTSG